MKSEHANNNEAIEKHYLNNRGRLVKRLTIRSGTPEAAEDIIQEAYLRALLYYDPVRVKDIDRWFSILVTNALREYMNTENGHPIGETDEEVIEGVDCPNYNIHMMKNIMQLISHKNPIAREILMLHFECQYSPIEISRITEHSYANSHQVINRFRKEIKELIKD